MAPHFGYYSLQLRSCNSTLWTAGPALPWFLQLYEPSLCPLSQLSGSESLCIHRSSISATPGSRPPTDAHPCPSSPQVNQLLPPHVPTPDKWELHL